VVRLGNHVKRNRVNSWKRL